MLAKLLYLFTGLRLRDRRNRRRPNPLLAHYLASYNGAKRH